MITNIPREVLIHIIFLLKKRDIKPIDEIYIEARNLFLWIYSPYRCNKVAERMHWKLYPYIGYCLPFWGEGGGITIIILHNSNVQHIIAGHTVNNFLNKNALEVVEELKENIGDSLAALFKKVMNDAFGRIPTKYWIPKDDWQNY